MLPVIKLISCFLVHACFLIIMAGLYLIDGRMPSATWIQVLYYSFAASMLGLALTYFTSAVQVFFKDMAQIVGICLQFGMWLTPIMYDEAIFTSRASGWSGYSSLTHSTTSPQATATACLREAGSSSGRR